MEEEVLELSMTESRSTNARNCTFSTCITFPTSGSSTFLFLLLLPLPPVPRPPVLTSSPGVSVNPFLCWNKSRKKVYSRLRLTLAFPLKRIGAKPAGYKRDKLIITSLSLSLYIYSISII